jgi:hypothetical protein
VLMSTIRYVLFLFILDHIIDCLKSYHVCCTSQYNLLSSSRLLVAFLLLLEAFGDSC